jgi:hypothetical protein
MGVPHLPQPDAKTPLIRPQRIDPVARDEGPDVPIRCASTQLFLARVGIEERRLSRAKMLSER